MTYSVPTLKETIASVQSDIATRLSGADATPPRSMLYVLARVQAGANDDLNAYITDLARQIPWDNADDDLLIRWAAIWKIYRENPTGAAGPVNFSGTAGKIVPADTLLARADGIQYKLVADLVLTDGTGTGTVKCTSVGAVTTTDANTPLTLVSSVSGVSSNATVGSDGLGGGGDIESYDSVRARLLARVQDPPMGGSEADFIKWAKSVAGVTHVWVLPGWMGTGTVGITFMMDGRSNPIPLASDVALVQAAIDAERPVTGATFVFAPSPLPLNPVITLAPDSTAARTAVTAQLAALLASEATAKCCTLLLTHIQTAISTAAGVTDYTLASPTANVITVAGQISTLGTPTWD